MAPPVKMLLYLGTIHIDESKERAEVYKKAKNNTIQIASERAKGISSTSSDSENRPKKEKKRKPPAWSSPIPA
jgi:hypothetical protein